MAIESEYINHFNPIMLRIVRSNLAVRLITRSTDEMYYVLKYFVKGQKAVDNNAVLALSSYTNELEKE